MTLVIVKFRFVPKIRRNSVLCSREISFKRPRIVTRTFARSFLESSRKQRTKFAHFACVTFAQYCNCKIFLSLELTSYRQAADDSNCTDSPAQHSALSEIVSLVLVLTVTRCRPPLGQVMGRTLNHAICNIYLPKFDIHH